MQTELAPHLSQTPEGITAQKILNKCVHCGFCTATCPTYQLLGDELDGPRGRIYLIKQMAEGRPATEKTRLHLDRCLTCRNCESTCPSGVDYGHLIDIGRHWAEQQTQRPMGELWLRKLLAYGLTNKPLFDTGMSIGRLVRPLLPKVLKKKIPQGRPAGKKPMPGQHAERVLMLEGCVQPGMLPNINHATARVLDRLGVDALLATKAGCCGAIKFHLNEQEAALAEMKRNIDAWWPYITGEHPDCKGQAVDALIMNASGCGVTVKEYGHILKDDPIYRDKAAKVSSICMDLVEYLPRHTDALKNLLKNSPAERLVFHPPCTLQHGQKIKGSLEQFFSSLNIKVSLCQDSHLCCGSAGTYSILQADLSEQLREQKLNHLLNACQNNQASKIVSANIGCITHLQNDQKPVEHWIEHLDILIEQNNGYVSHS